MAGHGSRVLKKLSQMSEGMKQKRRISFISAIPSLDAPSKVKHAVVCALHLACAARLPFKLPVYERSMQSQ